MVLVHQEAQFVGYSLGDLEPVKMFHCWGDMIMFPNIADDSNSSCSVCAGVCQVGIEKSQPRGSCSSLCAIIQGLGLLVEQI